MAWSFNRWNRKLHRWGAIACCLPMLLVIITGILLQVKKYWTWVQPQEHKGERSELRIDWADIIETAKSVEEAEVQSWDDVNRLDVRPSKGLVKIRCNNDWELQIDSYTGELLSSEFRRSDIIESLHDGSWFHDAAKLWVFLPNGVILLLLWFTGIFLWWMPFGSKLKKRKRMANKKRED
jgi:uncharacterized iron-regulated membrane protein